MQILKTDSFIASYKGVNICGVYLLFKGEKVIYVGSTNYPCNRITTHNNSDKDFDRVGWISCLIGESSTLEANKIVEYNPKHNITLPSSERFTLKSSIPSYIESQVRWLIGDIPTVFSRKASSYIESDNLDIILNNIKDAIAKSLVEIHAKEIK